MPPRRGRSARNVSDEEATPVGTESPQYDLAQRPRAESNEPTPTDGEHEHEYTRRSSTVQSRSATRSRSPPRSYDRPRSRSPVTPSGEDPYAHGATLSASTPRPTRPTRLNYKPKLILRGHKRGVAAVRFSPDGKWIASASADCTLKIWDAYSGKLQHTLEGHLGGLSTLAWSPDSTLIASGSDDKSIRLWDAVSGKAHPIPFLGHHNYIYSIAFSPKGNMIVSGSYDEAVFLWDVRAARVMKSLPAHSDPVSGVDFVRDGTLIVSCAEDGLIRVWDTATGQCLRTLVHEDRAPVMAGRFAPNGKFVLAWTADNSIRLWDYVEGRAVKTYQGHINQKYSICGTFGTYGKDAHSKQEKGGDPSAKEEWAFIASGSEDGSVVLWDVGSKDILQQLHGHTGPVLGVDAHPTERRLVSCGLDKTIWIWVCDPDGEETDDHVKQEMTSHTDFVAQLAEAATLTDQNAAGE